MYTKNPNMPKVRRDAVNTAKKKGVRATARYFGFTPGAVSKWMKKAPFDGRMVIPTKSSRPDTNPNALPKKTVEKIIEKRLERERCAEVVFEELRNDGVKVSLSSVKRTLDRSGLTKKRSPWKRYHAPFPRPEALNPGDFLQIDTIHIVPRSGERFYIHTIIDLYSRWSYAKVVSKINTHQSLLFVREAQRKVNFEFKVLQSDNGPEFSSWFTEHVQKVCKRHRHSRVRKSNDNAHIERFNRTIQEECTDKVFEKPREFKKAISRVFALLQ